MVHGFLALGGSPRRHGLTQLEKRVSLDPGRGPGADSERICAHPGSFLPKATLARRRLHIGPPSAGGAGRGRAARRERQDGGDPALSAARESDLSPG